MVFNGRNNFNNNIINNGIKRNDLTDINENINTNIKENFSQSYISEQKNKNKLNLFNNGLDINNKTFLINEKKSKFDNKEIETKINNLPDKNIPKSEDRLGEAVKSKKEISNKVEVNIDSNIVNNIKNLISKSKNKIEKDLYEINKKDKENNSLYKYDNKKYHKSVRKKNNDEIKNKMNTNIERKNQDEFNNRYITDNYFNENKSIEKEKSFEFKRKKKLFHKKNNIQFNINNSSSIKNRNRINNENSFEKEYDLNNLSKNDSLSKKRNAFINYNDIDLNNLFSKSSKKESKKKFIKQNIIKSFEFKEENGGNFNKNEEKEYLKDDNDAIIEKSAYENNLDKKKELKKIIISKKIRNDIAQAFISKNNDENKKEFEKSELININEELKNKINELKKEVEFSKNELKKKDKKILKYLNKYDKIASENALNMFEIENLEEELIKNKNEMYIKTKKIKELTDKNNGLEQEMNQLKIYYKNKKNIFEYSKRDNDKNLQKDLKKIITNDILPTKEENNRENLNFEGLSVEELHNKRNEFIKERDNITILYEKLPIKLINKEQFIQKQELENKLKEINNNLMKIRLQLKIYNQ